MMLVVMLLELLEMDPGNTFDLRAAGKVAHLNPVSNYDDAVYEA